MHQMSQLNASPNTIGQLALDYGRLLQYDDVFPDRRLATAFFALSALPGYPEGEFKFAGARIRYSPLEAAHFASRRK
jgi:hypothetical protein